jgi:transposase-like protein
MIIKFPARDLKNPNIDLCIKINERQRLDITRKGNGRWRIWFGSEIIKDEFVSRQEALNWINENLEIKMIRTIVRKDGSPLN